MAIENIVIAGAGTMGYSMAQIFARYNYHVTIYDLKEEALETAKKRIKENTQILLQENEITNDQEKEIHQHLKYTTDLKCFENCDLVVESIIENVEIIITFINKYQKLLKKRRYLLLIHQKFLSIL